MNNIGSGDFHGKTLRIIVRIVGIVFTLAGTLMIVMAMMSFFVPTMYYAFPNFFLWFLPGFILAGIGKRITRLFPKEVLQEKETSFENAELESSKKSYERRNRTAIRKYVRCHKCDAENPPDAFRCVKCGASFENKKVCALCYKLVDKDARFCKNCGHDFNLD